MPSIQLSEFWLIKVSSNITRPMRVTLSGIVIPDNFVQPENARSKIVVTLLGIIMFDSVKQFLKAQLPIPVILFDKETLDKFS